MHMTTASAKPINVFFDSNILIQLGLPPGNETFQRIVDLVEYGLITVVTTDLNKTEIVRHHTDYAFGKLKPLFDRRSRLFAARYFGMQIPEISQAEARNQIENQISGGVESMFAALKANVLDIDKIKPSVIFGDYDRNEGLFGTQNKKRQFPDAFIFACLKSEASSDDQLLIVTDDPDFIEPAKRADYIFVVGSIRGLFEELQLLVDEPDPDLEPFLFGQLLESPDFLSFVEGDFYGLDDNRIEISCITIEFDSIIAFQQVNENAPLLVSATVEAPLDLKIDRVGDDPIESGTGKARVSFYVSVTIDENGDPIDITDLRVFDCSLDLREVYVSYFL